MVITRERIVDDGLIDGAPDLDVALQPNGVDLTVATVAVFDPEDYGIVERDTKYVSRVTEKRPVGTQWFLKPGPYLVTFNEVVKLPADVMAYLRPRSTLLRNGVALHTAVWDAGYVGRGQSLLTVHHPGGFLLGTDARIAQLVFHRLEQATTGYSGSYQGEGLDPVDEGFAERVDAFIEDYREALEALAELDDDTGCSGRLIEVTEPHYSPARAWAGTTTGRLHGSQVPDSSRERDFKRIDALFGRLSRE